MVTNRIQHTKQPSQSKELDTFLKEEQLKLNQQQRRLSQGEDNNLDISEEVELLSYNEYIANAKIAKKQKHIISNSGSKFHYLYDYLIQKQLR